jgi:hypothetical protein
MKLYSQNSQYPKPIPFRIRLSDGTTRTDPSTFTEKEIADAGYTEVSEKPSITDNQILDWDRTAIDWVVRDKTAEEIQSELASKWYNIRLERDQKIRDIAWRYERYVRNQRLNITQVDDINRLDEYVQALANMPQVFSNPDDIVWPSYTTATVLQTEIQEQ